MKNPLFLLGSYVYKMSTKHTFYKFFCFLFFFFTLAFLSAEEDLEAITAIILINGSAELVDVNIQGEILKRHISIPDYFTSGRSHKRSLGKSLKMIEQYGSSGSPILPKSSSIPSKCLQSFMVAMTKMIKQEKRCAIGASKMNDHMNSPIFSLADNHPTVNLTPTNQFALSEDKKQRAYWKEKKCYFQESVKNVQVYSSELTGPFVLSTLKFFSTKDKEPLRHRIV